jgi:hypothetical protein
MMAAVVSKAQAILSESGLLRANGKARDQRPAPCRTYRHRLRPELGARSRRPKRQRKAAGPSPQLTELRY